MSHPFERAPDSTLPSPLRWPGKPISITFTEESPNTDQDAERCLGYIDGPSPTGLQAEVHFAPNADGSYSCSATIRLADAVPERNSSAKLKRAMDQVSKTLHNEYDFPGYQSQGAVCIKRRATGQHFQIKRTTSRSNAESTDGSSIEITAVNTTAASKELQTTLNASEHSVEGSVVELARLTGIVANSISYQTGSNEETVLLVAIPGKNAGNDSLLPPAPKTTDVAVYTGRPEHKGFPSFSSLGGLDQQIKEVVEWAEDSLTPEELLERYGIERPGALLLEGVSGTGKTSIVRAMAKKYGYSLTEVSVTDVLDPYVGATQQKLRKLYDTAQGEKGNSPVILFFDEFDGLFAGNAGGNPGVARALIAELKTILTSRNYPKVLTIAAANSVDDVDPALLRQGRFDKVVKFPMPNLEARAEIWKVLLYRRAGMFAVMGTEVFTDASQLAHVDYVQFEELASATEGMAPADIHGVTTLLMRAMMREERSTGARPPSYGHTAVLRAIQTYRQSRPSGI